MYLFGSAVAVAALAWRGLVLCFERRRTKMSFQNQRNRSAQPGQVGIGGRPNAWRLSN
jgi:hypothetical protein